MPFFPLCQSKAPVAEPDMITRRQSPLWHALASAAPETAAGEAAKYRLVCVECEDIPKESLLALPVECRAIDLPAGVTQVGRRHQRKYFDGLGSSAWTQYVSRTHLELAVRAGSDVLSATNCSPNPLVAGEFLVTPRDTAELRAGQTLSFVRPSDNGNLVSFLKFEVQEV